MQKTKKLLVIPSIDIKNRKTVRVVQGIPELNCKEYGNDPVEMAMIWRAENAKIIHVVDFDLAHEHKHTNMDLIQEICESVVIPVEFGGGIRDIFDAELAFKAGVFRIVVGSVAYDNPDKFFELIQEFGAKRISAAIDVIDNEVVVHSRKERTGISPVDYAKSLEDLGAERVIITDVSRNGMLNGPNIELSARIAKETNLNVTHSGGITTFKDLIDLYNISNIGIDSAIVGRALYENRFACQKLWRIAESGIFN